MSARRPQATGAAASRAASLLASVATPWVRATIRRGWLPLWFLIMSIIGVVMPQLQQPNLLVDARLYVAATRVWLAGGDPWSVDLDGLLFGAPPPTLLAVAPLTFLQDPLASLTLWALTLAGAIATVRMLRLPPWWLLFPPLLQAVVAGNLQTLLVPLVVGGMFGALAPLAKLYAALPLLVLGRWRPLAACLVAHLFTAPLVPWDRYLANFAQINAALAAQSQMGPTPIQSLLVAPVVLVALWIVGREHAAWLVVPALWPFQQWYYATLVMPTRSSLVAALITLPIPFTGALAALAMAAATVITRRRRVTSTGSTAGRGGTPPH